MAYKYPYTASFRRSAAGQDERVVEDGMEIGKKLILHKGVAEKGSKRPPRIEYSGN